MAHATVKKKHIGNRLDEFLADEGLLAEAQAEAMKRVISWHVEKYMRDKSLSKSALAAELHTSRSALDRLLDTRNTSLNLNTLATLAACMGKRVEIRFR